MLLDSSNQKLLMISILIKMPWRVKNKIRRIWNKKINKMKNKVKKNPKLKFQLQLQFNNKNLNHLFNNQLQSLL